jgi:hypothetical protein
MSSRLARQEQTDTSVVPIAFYDDEVRSWQERDGRIYVIIRDPSVAMGLDPDG